MVWGGDQGQELTGPERWAEGVKVTLKARVPIWDKELFNLSSLSIILFLFESKFLCVALASLKLAL